MCEEGGGCVCANAWLHVHKREPVYSFDEVWGFWRTFRTGVVLNLSKNKSHPRFTFPGTNLTTGLQGSGMVDSTHYQKNASALLSSKPGIPPWPAMFWYGGHKLPRCLQQQQQHQEHS
jgi:hypothetical protein